MANTYLQYLEYADSIQCDYNQKIIDLKAIKSDFKRFEAIRNLYSLIMTELRKEGFKAQRTKYPVARDFYKSDLYTPIEKAAFEVFYYEQNLPIFPQYPVLNYFIDFAIPPLKIAIELDGAQYHDVEKDSKRDEMLKEKGWKTFRVRGFECYKLPSLEDILESGGYDLKDFFTNSIEGFATALKVVYFGGSEDSDFYRFSIMSLEHHRIIGFDLFKKP